MLQNIILWAIIALCALFIGRKFFRQWRAALDPNAKIPCDCGCSDCTSIDCKEK